MLQKIKKITALLLLSTMIFSISYADDIQDQLDVKTEVNNMRNSVHQPGILGDIFTKIFDAEGKVKEMYLSIVTTFTQGFIPVWDDAGKLIDSPIFSTGSFIGIGTTNPTVTLEVNGNIIAAEPTIAGHLATKNYVDLNEGAKALNDLSDAIYDGSSIFIGEFSGINDDGTTNGNTAVGNYSLQSNTSGSNNTANGIYSLMYNTFGTNNIANGYQSLQNNISGSFNVASGRASLKNNTTGNFNIGLGYNAGQLNSTGSLNVFLGNNAGYNEMGSSKLYIDNSNTTTPLIHGDFATDKITINGDFEVTGTTIGGVNALNDLSDAKSDGSSIFIGTNAGNSDDGGNGNISIGNYSLQTNTIGRYNVASGWSSLENNTEGDYNVANGYVSLKNNITGGYNTANGGFSLYSNTIGNFNSANGYQSLFNNINGDGNTAYGSNSLRSNTTGDNNLAIGNYSLYNNISSIRNTAVGHYSLYNNIGNYNTSNGYRTLYSNISGEYNTSYGIYGLGNNISGNNNISSGAFGLYNNTTGNDNVGLGYSAGYLNSTGSLNLFLGNSAGYNEMGSNTLYIDNSSTTTPLIKGDFATNKLTINGSLQVTQATDTTCDTANEGTIRFDSATKNFFGCDGTIWKQLDN